MLTQQQLVDQLNRLTVHYNVDWESIKYDADKAIYKINSFLGANYPKMSERLLGPQDTYTVKDKDGFEDPIFPEEFMHSVVIPYIASEILARDEEFTTIYNKYLMEIEEGLFTMFQKVFNKVPFVFRQDPEMGVFFAVDTSQGVEQRNKINQLPEYKYRVYYHINNDDIVLGDDTSNLFASDNTAYEYGKKAKLLGWTTVLLSYTGALAYHFKGWSRNIVQVTEDYIVPDSIVEMTNDLHLYAQWDIVSTLFIDTDGSNYGRIRIKPEYMKSISYLEIPDRVNNVVVKKIAPNFLTKNSLGVSMVADRLAMISLPKFLVSIDSLAFANGSALERVVFKETPVSMAYTGISIGSLAFANTPLLKSILLPTNVVAVGESAFPGVDNKDFRIRCRTLERNVIWKTNIQEGWDEEWYEPTSSIGSTYENYTVSVEWGYNG